MYGNEVGGVSQLKNDRIDKLIDEMKLLTAKKWNFTHIFYEICLYGR